MPYKFPCSHCNKDIVVRYLKNGDQAKCPFCNKTTTVPGKGYKVTEEAIKDLGVPQIKKSEVKIEKPQKMTEEELQALWDKKSPIMNRFVAVCLVFAYLAIRISFTFPECHPGIIAILATLAVVCFIAAIDIASLLYIKSVGPYFLFQSVKTIEAGSTYSRPKNAKIIYIVIGFIVALEILFQIIRLLF